MKTDCLQCNNFYYTVNEKGEAIIQGAEVWTEELIILEELDGHVVTEIGDGAFDTDVAAEKFCFTDGPVSLKQFAAKIADTMVLEMIRTKLKKVVLPQTIRRIGVAAFYQNNDLSEINIPQNVEVIDSLAFAGVFGVRCFEIPASANVYREYPNDPLWEDQAAFERCEDAEFVYIR